MPVSTSSDVSDGPIQHHVPDTPSGATVKPDMASMLHQLSSIKLRVVERFVH